MTLRNPMSYVFDADIETEIGVFRVRSRLIHDRDGKPFDIQLSIGGEHDCIHFSIPFGSENIFLSFAQSTKPGVICTLDSRPIKGNSTVKMMYFATTLLKEITNKSIIEFTDMSNIDCENPDGSVTKMPLPIYNFMFYGETWYESKFGAILKHKHDRDEYELIKCMRTDPRHKMPFDFNNISLDNAFQKIYEESESWGDFFDKLSKTYKKDRCALAQPWIRKAYSEMTKNGFVIPGSRWFFSYSDFPVIPYKILKLYSTGEKLQQGGYNSPLPHMYDMFDWSLKPNTSKLDYTSLLVKANQRKTRRRQRSLKFGI